MKDDRLYLTHILECIERVRQFTQDGEEHFYVDEKTQFAVLRALQIMAESTTRLSPTLRARRHQIDWRAIAGFRNFVVHDYFKIELEEIWRIVQNDLSPLAKVVAAELETIGDAST